MMQKNLQRLPDRGIRRNDKQYSKQVYHDTQQNCVWIQFNLPHGETALEQSLKGLRYFAEEQSCTLLKYDQVNHLLQVSYCGPSLLDLLKQDPTQTAHIIESFCQYLADLPRQKMLHQEIHPYFNYFLNYYQKQSLPDTLDQRLECCIVQLKACLPQPSISCPGILDARLANFCSQDKQVKLVDFDNFTPHISPESMLGFFLADLDMEQDFEIFSLKQQRPSLLLLEGALSRWAISLFKPLLFNRQNKRHFMQMQQRLDYCLQQLSRPDFLLPESGLQIQGEAT